MNRPIVKFLFEDSEFDLILVSRGEVFSAVESGFGVQSIDPQAFDRRILDISRIRFTERWEFVVRDDCTDDLSDTVAEFIQLARRAWQRHNKLQFLESVSLYEKATDETNGRYSLIYEIPEINPYNPIFHSAFEQARTIEDFGITITRGVWRNGQPGVLPSSSIVLEPTSGFPYGDPQQVFHINHWAESDIDIVQVLDGQAYTIIQQGADLGNGDLDEFDSVSPDWDWEATAETGDLTQFDSSSTAGSSTVSASEEAPKNGQYSYKFFIDTSQNTCYCLETTPASETECAIEFWIWLADMTATPREAFNILTLSDGVNAFGVIQLDFRTDGWKARYYFMNDAGAYPYNSDIYAIVSGWNHIKMYWKASSGAGNDDGIAGMYLNGVLVERETGMDTDTFTLESYDVGNRAVAGNTLTGTFYMDDILGSDDLSPPSVIEQANVGDGRYGLMFTIEDTTNRHVVLAGPNADTHVVADVWFNLGDLIMAEGDTFPIMNDDSYNINLNLAWEAGKPSLRNYTQTDGGLFPPTGDYIPIERGLWYHCRVVWRAATGAGANDGYSRFYLNGVLVNELTGIDNDTLTITEVRWGATIGIDATTYGAFYLDRPRWWLPNQDLFPATAVANDALCIGWDIPAYSVVMNLLTALADIGATWVFEYWNGAWTGMTIGDDLMIYPRKEPFYITGSEALYFSGWSDWTTTAINGYTKYWIRIRLTAVDFWTTTPEIGDEPLYTQNKPYFSVPSTALTGDASPLFLLRQFAFDGGDGDNSMCSISRLLMALKTTSRSNDLDQFASHLNLGGRLPEGWAIYYGDDTNALADEQAPDGYVLHCDFTTDTDMVLRAKLLGVKKAKHFAGEHRVFLRYRQETAYDPEDIAFKLVVKIGDDADTAPQFETQTIESAGSYDQVLADLTPDDTLLLPFLEIVSADELDDLDIIFELYVTQQATGPDFYGVDLIFLPAEEWIADMNDPISDTEFGSSALRGYTILETDSGILNPRTQKMIRSLADVLSPAETWSRRSTAFQIEPEKHARIYSLIASYTDGWGAGPFLGNMGQGFLDQLYAQMIYFYLRGNR